MPSVELINSFAERLPSIIETAGHGEIWGVDLSFQPASDPSKLILGKYLKAHKDDLTQASEALQATLVWRKEFKPRSAAFEELHDSKFDGLGYITPVDDEIITWNIYGQCKGMQLLRIWSLN